MVPYVREGETPAEPQSQWSGSNQLDGIAVIGTRRRASHMNCDGIVTSRPGGSFALPCVP